MNKQEAQLTAALILVGTALAGCQQSAEAQPTPDLEGIKNQVGTELAGTIFAQGSAQPSATETPTPFTTPTPNLLSEPTPTLGVLDAGEDFLTQYLGFKNLLVNELSGESKTPIET